MLEKDMTCGKDTRLVSDKTAWHQYYSEKRIIHQWMQVHLLQNLPVSRILEIGPHLGLVTAMLCNAGYGVSILDIAKRFDFPNVDCITEDIRNISPEQLLGFDAVLCCEVLEHIPFDDVPNIVLKFSNVRYLIISVPYMANQLTFNLYINAYTFKKYTSIKKLLNFRKFKTPETKNWENHKWEIGYKQYPLKSFRKILEKDFKIIKMEFTSDCRSVFFVCENKR